MNDLGKKLLAGMTVENSELDFKIKTCTELYRKGFGRIFLLNADGAPFSGNAVIELEQTSHEYKFGANIFMLGGFPDKEKNAQFEKVFPDFFNLAVIPFYWRDLEPVDGQPRFAKDSPTIYRRPPPDLCVEYCAANGLTMKGHPLCWNQWLPSWLPLDRREWMRRLEKHFAGIAERYADKIFIFDAINEVLSAKRDVNSPYPDGIMEAAFRLGEKYFPGAQLILNEDKHWWTFQGEHSHFLLLAKELISHGIRPGGLGFQYHFFSHYFEKEYVHFMNAENLWRMLDLYRTLALPCSLTEISVISRRDMLGDAADEFQRIFVEKLYRLWFAHPSTEAIVWWNPVDGTAAGDAVGGTGGENAFRAGLYNYDLSLKQAGKTVRELVKNEWHTSTTMNYTPEGDNRFHGFYGTYAAKIKTDSGVFDSVVTLGKFAPTNLKITLK